MAHSLILGMTESGKTTLAKSLAREYKAQGLGVLVLDPLGDPEWGADYQSDDPSEFLQVFWDSRSCVVFIDEAADAVGRYDTVMQRTATRGRHWGHSVHYLTQRGTQIARTVRDQCSHLFLFATALEDCKVHAREWNDPALLAGNQLRRGEYLHAGRFRPVTRGNAFTAKSVP